MAASNNRVQGNRIGTDVTGTQKLPNAKSGEEIGDAGNFVGGMEAGAGNLISGNDEHGVLLRSTGATNNAVEQGHIFEEHNVNHASIVRRR